MTTFAETVAAAIRDIEEHGYDSQARVDDWLRRISEAARAALVPESVLQDTLRRTLHGIYTRTVERGGLLRVHKGVAPYTIKRVAPQLRAELDRRIAASAQLIRLNRAQMIAKTEQRFSGWATSVPAGGSETVERAAVAADVKKALKSLPFEERRVMIDQGHKLVSSINDIVATAGGAIAARWHSHWRQPGYNYRKDHKERDERVYLIRGSWAHEKGLVKPGANGYTDQITAPGQEVYCQCSYSYVYSLRGLPDDMVTAKGRAALAGAASG